MIEGSLSSGQYSRNIRTKSPGGAGSQFDSLSDPGPSQHSAACRRQSLARVSAPRLCPLALLLRLVLQTPSGHRAKRPYPEWTPREFDARDQETKDQKNTGEKIGFHRTPHCQTLQTGRFKQSAIAAKQESGLKLLVRVSHSHRLQDSLRSQ
jgi:hypothetical protein